MKFKDWLVLIIPVAFLTILMLMPFVPEQIPMQWSLNGEVNWSMSKWFLPLVGAVPFLFYVIRKFAK